MPESFSEALYRHLERSVEYECVEKEQERAEKERLREAGLEP
jgi:hypothetical protein